MHHKLLYMKGAIMWADKHFHSFDWEMKKRYGEKIYRLSLDGGFTCPNRDGTLGTRGCIFCSEGGSGEFAGSRNLSVSEQIEEEKLKVADKYSGGRYIAYFQAYTGTYASPVKLKKIYEEAIKRPDISILSIATRPDCLPKETLNLLKEMNKIKPVWIELGLQTIHEKTSEYIRRGYPLSVFDDAVENLSRLGIETIVHLILGLPGENADDMIETTKYISKIPIAGVKYHMLNILKGTDLYKDYLKHKFHVLTMEEYTEILIKCIEHLPPDIVIHRLTGDGPRKLLVEPEWVLHKKYVLNYINHEFSIRDTWQWKLFSKTNNI